MNVDPQIQNELDNLRLVMEAAKERRIAILASKNSGVKNSVIMAAFGIKTRARLFQILSKAGWKSSYRPRKVEGAINA